MTANEEQRKKTPLVVIVIIIVAGVLGIALLIAFIGGYFLNWDWTGFSSYTPPVKVSNFQRGKTLWDWLQLLFIPAVLAIGGFWFNRIQNDRDKEAAKERERLERVSREDYQRQTALQAYIDKMSDLLFDKELETDERLQSIVRARTLAALPMLDSDRLTIVGWFLQNSGLYRFVKGHFYLVDMSNTDLRIMDLSDALFKGAILINANLRGTNLRRAILIDAKLIGADLTDADLTDADLTGANLREAKLIGADLTDADLTDADLTDANIEGAKVTEEQLKNAKALPGGRQLEPPVKALPSKPKPEPLKALPSKPKPEPLKALPGPEDATTPDIPE